jgi:hypothetical protein
MGLIRILGKPKLGWQRETYQRKMDGQSRDFLKLKCMISSPYPDLE